MAEGKHSESAYFAYFDRTFGMKTILAMRKMKNVLLSVIYTLAYLF